MQNPNQESQQVLAVVSPQRSYTLSSKKSYFVLKSIQLTKTFYSTVNLYLSKGKRKFLLWTVKSNSMIKLNKSLNCCGKSKLVVEGGELIIYGEFHTIRRYESKKEKMNQKKKVKQGESNESSEQSEQSGQSEKSESDSSDSPKPTKIATQQTTTQAKNQFIKMNNPKIQTKILNTKIVNPVQSQPQATPSLKNLCQLAIVSSKIIKMIIEENSTHHQALAAKIKKLTVQDFGDINKENFDAVLQLFTEGVILQQCFIHQERIKKSRKKKNQKFIFHPTWMGTTPIFNFLDQSPDNPIMLITGAPGIGKTVSLISYCLLMDHVFRYALIATKEEIEENIQKQIIVRPLKVIYWSVHEDDDQQSIKRYFIQQCPEFKKYIQKKSIKLDKLDQFLREMKTYYHKVNVETLVIIDQINFIAKLCREINNKQQSLNLKKKQISQLQQNQNQKLKLLVFQYLKIKNNLLKAENFFKKLNKFRRLLHSNLAYKVYNSAVNIYNHLLFQQEQQNICTLDFSNHDYLSRYEINYQSIVRLDKGRIQLAEYILFQFGMRGKNCIEEEIKEIKTFLQKIQVSFLTPQTIYNEISKSHQENQSYLNLEQFIKRMTIFQNKIISKIKSDSKKFFVKISSQNKERTLKAIFQIYKQAYKDMLSNKNQKVIIDLSRFQQCKDQYEKLIDKSLFFKSDYNKYEFMHSNNLFYQLTISDFVDSCLCFLQTSIKITNLSPSVFGTIFEHCLLEATRLNRKFSFIYFNSSNGNCQFYTIANTEKFLQFNSRNNQNEVNYLNNMDDIFQLAVQIPGLYVFGEPVNLKKKRSLTSFCVDFCLVMYDIVIKKFDVIFYDVKTGSTLDKDGKKKDIQQFKKRFAQVKYNKNDKIIIELKFVILCDSSSLPSNAEKSNFICVDIESIDLKQYDEQPPMKLGLLIKSLSQIKRK